MSPIHLPLSRRDFLKTFGLVSAALLTPSWSEYRNHRQFSRLEGVPLRVGVAIPSYAKERRRAINWLKGLRFGLNGQEVKLIPYTVEDRLRSISKTVKELVEAEKVDVLVGSVSPFASVQVASAIENSPVTFINAEVGANLVFPYHVRPNVFHHTLHYWQANWAAGEWAASQLGKRGAILATFYEAGFDALAAFQIAFENAGGEVLRTVITHSPTETWLAQETMSRLAGAKPDFVFLMGSGEEAIELLAAYKQSPLNERVPMIGAGFALAQGTRTPSINTFATDFTTATRETPDALALLGYETALLIQNASQVIAQTGVSLSQALANVSFTSPRGRILMDTDRHATIPSAFVDGDGNPLGHLSSVSSTAHLHAGWSDIRTGWITPYFSL